MSTKLALNQNDKVYLNINGTHYETLESTLKRFPNTLLGNEEKRKEYYIKERNEYYFARDKTIFDFILFFYQSNGILSKPKGIEDNVFKKEINFFRLFNPDIREKPHRNNGFIIKYLHQVIHAEISLKSIPGIIACLSYIIILLSSIGYCFKTKKDSQYQHVWIKVEILAIIWYTIELAIRYACEEYKWKYICSCFGIIDTISVFPFYLEQCYLAIWGSNGTSILLILQMLQIFRIVKIARYVTSLQILARALCDCHGQLLALLFFFIVNCFLCSCVLFDAEEKENHHINSILDTFWFTIITMTTVGYGDVVPKTSMGKVVGVFTILTGIITLIHLFLSVYLSYFCLLYENKALMKEIKRENLAENVVVVSGNEDGIFLPVVSSGHKNIKKEYSEKFLEELYYIKK